MSLVIGLDIGTSAAKAVAFDTGGAEKGSGEAGYSLREPAPGEAVQDPDEVLGAALQALGSSASAAGASQVEGVSLSTAMHSLIGLDSHDRPLTPLLTWADNRAAAQAERLRRDHPGLHARTGTPLHPMSPLAKLVWWRENDPDLCKRVRRWVGIKELILHRLTGEWMIDRSCASGTGLMSLRQLDWDPEALELAGVDAQQLAPIVPGQQAHPLGEGTAGLPAGLPVLAGGGDGPLANLGVGAVKPGVAACSIGTSGALRLVVERPVIDQARRLFCYALAPERWAIGGAINNGGSVLQWAADSLGDPHPDGGADPRDALLELAAGVPAGSEGLIMLPYLLSERAPHWDSLARGAYIGLRHFHTRGHLARAAIEGVCQQLALVLGSMRDAGNEVTEIRASGGFARSALWRQTLTDALGMPVAFAAGHEGSAFGAALIGMVALELVGSIEHAAELVKIDEVREPDAEAAATYEQQRPLFAELYDDLMPAFRALRRSERAAGD